MQWFNVLYEPFKHAWFRLFYGLVDSWTEASGWPGAWTLHPGKVHWPSYQWEAVSQQFILIRLSGSNRQKTADDEHFCYSHWDYEFMKRLWGPQISMNVITKRRIRTSSLSMTSFWKFVWHHLYQFY